MPYRTQEKLNKLGNPQFYAAKEIQYLKILKIVWHHHDDIIFKGHISSVVIFNVLRFQTKTVLNQLISKKKKKLSVTRRYITTAFTII